MSKSDFKDYMNASNLLQFNLIPYFKVFQLNFTNDDLHRVDYKLSHSGQFLTASIGICVPTRPAHNQ